MSLDVYLEEPAQIECACGGACPCHEKTLQMYSANITHNLGQMADAAGLYRSLWRPEENGISKALQLISPLTIGLAKLRNDPVKYSALNPPNGWGSYEGLVSFVDDYLEACKQHPEADVRSSR